MLSEAKHPGLARSVALIALAAIGVTTFWLFGFLERRALHGQAETDRRR